jgi:selenide,water dikinase
MRGQCRAGWFQELTAGMLQSNAAASKIFREAGVVACTDVTGFGLAGHLLEMLDASRLSARLIAEDIPLYPGFVDVVEQGIVSSLHEDNACSGCRIQGSSPLPAWLYDPQTSGGLLAAVRPERTGSTLNQLHQAGYLSAKVVGIIEAISSGDQPRIEVE